MKTNTLITALAFAALMCVSCTKEAPEEPNADFRIYRQMKDGTIIETDTVQIGDYITFEAIEPAEMVVFYPGKRGYRYSKSRFFGGDNVGFSAPNGKLTNIRYYINDVGSDTIVCVATNYGNWSNDFKRAVVSKIITVYQ